MTRSLSLAAASTLIAAVCSFPVAAQTIRPNLNPTVRVGQTVVIKGVRGRECGQTPGAIAPLPQSSLGTFSSGAVGQMSSRSCGTTPARELRFTGRKPGKETVTAFDDSVTITVVP